MSIYSTFQNKMNLFIFLICILLLSSCTIAKRVHLPGYHIEPLAKSIKSKPVYISDNKSDVLFARNPFQSYSYNKMMNKPLYILPLQDYQMQIVKKSVSNSVADSLCADIYMRNGDIIKGVIIEVGVTEIKYKRCGFAGSPVYVVRKSEAFMIEYPNGTRDIFKKEEFINQEQIIHIVRDERKVIGVGSFVISLIAAFTPLFVPLWVPGVLAFLGLFSAMSALNKANEPDKYKGKGFAIAAAWISLLTLVAVLVLTKSA